MAARMCDGVADPVLEDDVFSADLSPATWALMCASMPKPTSPTTSPTLRQTRSAFQLSHPPSPRFPPTPAHTERDSLMSTERSGGGMFGWARWYREAPASQVRASAEPTTAAVSDEITNRFKEALEKRRKNLDLDRTADDRKERVVDQDGPVVWNGLDGTGSVEFVWPEGRTSLGSTISLSGDDASVAERLGGVYDDVDPDDFPATPDYSPGTSTSASSTVSSYDRPPLVSRDTAASSCSSNLRSTQSTVTLKAPRMLRRVSSSSSILTAPVELPPRSPHSPSTSPVLGSSGDPFTSSSSFSSPSLSASTSSSVHSDSTSSTATLSSNTSATSSTSTASSTSSSSSFRSRISTLKKAASSAALNLFYPRDPAPPLPPTASVLLQNVLLRHDHSAEPPSTRSPRHGPSRAADPSDPDDRFDDVESPSSLSFPPFDPWTPIEPCSDACPTSPHPHYPPPAAFPPDGSPPRPVRVLARQRSFIDPQTRSLRTAPSLTCTPPTPDRNKGTTETRDDQDEGEGSGESSAGSGNERRSPTRRKRGKRKGSRRALRQAHD
ncbi:hypothetical protein JCM10212_005169 [Sporobolomyces blumeae]